MGYRDVNEDSKLVYYVIDNESQMADMNFLWEKFGGRKVYTAEITDHINEDTVRGVAYFSVFLILPPDPFFLRVFMGHGISDKPIAKFKPPRHFSALDYYNCPGLKWSWHLDHYGHQIQVPYDKRVKFGLPASDLFLNPELDLKAPEKKKALFQKYGIKTDRPVILFSPSFNSKDLEFYYRLFVEQFKDNYYLIVRCHDREFYFDDYPYPNVYHYKGLDNPAELIALADYYIGDGSSVDNIAIYADIPMVLVKPQVGIVGDVPYEFDMRNYVPYFAINPDGPFKSIVECMDEAATPHMRLKRQEYIKTCFDYNDGHCIERFYKRHQSLINVVKARIAGKRDTRSHLLVNLWNRSFQGKGLMDIDRPGDIDYSFLTKDCI